MKRTVSVIALALASIFSNVSASPAKGDLDPAIKIRKEMQNWNVESMPMQNNYVLLSPSYALRYGGCARHVLSFPVYQDKIDFSSTQFETLYFAMASGLACSNVAKDAYFRIDDMGDVESVLEFVRYIYDGPRKGRDKFTESDVGRIVKCFLDPYRKKVRVINARASWEGDANQKVQVTIRCPILGQFEELVVKGSSAKNELEWKVVGQPRDL